MKKNNQGVLRRHAEMERQSTRPIGVPRSLRGHEISTLTSLPAGRMVPIAAAPLLREDSVRRGQVRLSFEMNETAELLMNAVHVNVKAYLVPFLAFDRFDGMDALNRAYQDADGNTIDFFTTEPRGAVGSNEIIEYLGLHAQSGDEINMAYQEAYNIIWNHRATNRSKSIAQREINDKTLAPAFWNHARMRHIVPDFEQALIDGEIALDLGTSTLQPAQELPVKGQKFLATGGGQRAGSYKESDGTNPAYTDWYTPGHENSGWGWAVERQDGVPNVRVEMPEISLAGSSISVLLSNIDQARKTAAFAKLREQFSGHDDEYIIDMLMSGMTVPEQAWQQPMLLAAQDTIFGMAKRYASDGASLTESVVNGATYVDLNIRVPRVATGGIIMIVAEISPDQLWERQQDPLLTTATVDELPEFQRDELDPEKVDVVYNQYVDSDHDTPDAVFGYEPMNAKWDIKARRIGGKFYKPAADTPYSDLRERVWASETANPTLNEHHYICTDINTSVFAVQNVDPFEVVAAGQMVIEGNTVFGGALLETTDNYAKVLEKAPTEQIIKPEA